MKAIKREDAIWLAGLLEGEGCLTQTRPAGQGWHLSVEMTDRDVVETAARIMDRPIRGPRRHGSNGRKKDTWRATAAGRDQIYAILAAIYPWLHSRRQQKARDFFSWFRTARPGLRRAT